MRTNAPDERTSLEELGESIARTAAQIETLTHQLLRDLREFDRRGGWAQQGALSCAHWLSWRCGLAPGAARERVRVARRLGELPKLEAAVERGEITYSKARAITRIATDGNEEPLLDLARAMTAAQLEKTCRLYEQAAPRERPTERGEAARRGVFTRRLSDGTVVIEAWLAPEEGETVLKAMDASAETPDRAAGLVTMAERALVAGTDGTGRNPVEVILTVDAAALVGQTEGGEGLSRDTVRRLCCDAGLVPVTVDSAGTPLDVGRKTRVIPAPLLRALRVRDGGCRFPGCTNRRFLDAHHIEHWMHGGETKLDNLHLVCRRHHRALHEHGFDVKRAADGTLTFLDPLGRVLPGVPAAPAQREPDAALASAPARPPVLDPDPADYDLCVAILQRADGAAGLA